MDITAWFSKHAFDSSKTTGYPGKSASLLCSGMKPGAALAWEGLAVPLGLWLEPVW